MLFLSQIQTNDPTTVEAIRGFVNRIMTYDGTNSIYMKAQYLGEFLQEGCRDIALAIMIAVITAQLTFVGVNIAMRRPFAEQFTNFTRNLIICFIMIQICWPQEAIRVYGPQLSEAGKTIGENIIRGAKEYWHNRGTTPYTSEICRDPILYWATFLGDPNNPNSKFKVRHVKWLFSLPDNFFTTTTVTEDEITDDSFAGRVGQGAGGLLGITSIPFSIGAGILSGRSWEESKELAGQVAVGIYDGVRGAVKGFASFVTKLADVAVAVILVVILGPTLFAMGFTSLMTQVGAYTLPAFTQVGLVVGSKYTLEVVMSLGIALMPLMFFERFKNIWFEYLIVCTSIAIVPMMYYIFSALGFLVATEMYFAIAPDPGQPGSGLAAILYYCYETGLVALFKDMGMGGSVTDVVIEIMTAFIGFMSHFIFYTANSSIVAGIVAAGSGMSVLAIPAAKSWHKSFTSIEMIEQIAQIFSGIGQSVAGASSQALGSGISMGMNVMGGAIKGVGNVAGT